MNGSRTKERLVSLRGGQKGTRVEGLIGTAMFGSAGDIDSGCALSGRNILIMEDDYLQASYLADMVRNERGHAIGPAASLNEGLEILRRAGRIDGAIVDINLRGQLAYPLIEGLRQRSTPVILVSGYDRSAIPARFADIPLCQKPVLMQDLRELLGGVFRQSQN